MVIDSCTGSPSPTQTMSSPVSIRGARRHSPFTTSTLTVALPAASIATKEDSPRLMTAWMSPMDSRAPGSCTGR